MNKKFTEFFKGLGFSINNNNAYGTQNGYEVNVNVAMMDNVSPLRMHITCYTTDDQKSEISRLLTAAAVRYLRFSFTEYGLMIGLNDFTVGKLIQRMPQINSTVFGILEQCGAKGLGWCPICGAQSDSCRPFETEGMSISIDSECVMGINARISGENEAFAQAPGHYGRGFLGALLGGLAGVVLAAVLFYVGYVSSLSALVAVIAGAVLYQKFGGKRDKVMVIILAATSIVCMLSTVAGFYIFSAAMGAAEAGLEISALNAFQLCMQDADFSRGFYADLLMMLLFSILGVVFQVVSLSRGIKRPEQIK